METFYSDAMDRAGGWYKKKIKLWLLGLGFTMAVCLNIDTIKICKKAFTDKDALKTTADKIAKKSATYHLATDTVSNTYIVKRLDSTGKEVSKMMIKNPQTVDPTVTELKTIQQSAQDIEGLREDYKEATGYILGYSNWSNAIEQWFGNKTDEAGDRIQTFLLKLLGIIITSFALQLGSDYWFGLLTKTVNIRSTGVNSDNERKNRS